MNDEEILIKAIQIAVKKGYRHDIVALNDGINIIERFSYNLLYEERKNTYYSIIFSHDFAEKFWGKEDVDDNGRTLAEAWEAEWKESGHFMDFDEFDSDFGFDIPTKIAYHYHLEKMVLCKEPLKYLEKFL